MPTDTLRVTCDDCFFRRHLLCALRLPEPCPTFRRATRAGLVPPPQASLVAPRTAVEASATLRA
jgi:hypothetical protein